MFRKVKTVMFVEALLAFITLFILNYFVLGMYLFLSCTGAAGFALLLAAWTGNRYYEKRQKQ